LYQGCTVTKTSHLPIRYFLALLWAHPILHISTITVNSRFASFSYTLERVSPALGVSYTLVCFTLRWIGCGSLRLFASNRCRNDKRQFS